MLKVKVERKSPYLYIVGTVAGQRVYESTGTADRRRAEAYRLRREQEIWDAATLGRKPVATWAEAVNAYLDLGKSSRYLLKITQYLGGDLPLDQIDQTRVNAAAKTICSGASNATLCRQIYGPITWVLHCAANSGLEGVPSRKIQHPKIPKRKVTRWATDDYLAELLPHCSDELVAVILLMTYTGMRTSEALGLDAQAFKIQPGMVLVPRTKNGEARLAPLPPAVQQAVARILPRRGRAFAWTTTHGLCWALKAACRRASIDYLSPHKLGRHAFAARLLKAGYDIKTVKEAGRWKSLQVVDDSYGHLEQGAAHRAMLHVAGLAENSRSEKHASPEIGGFLPKNRPSEGELTTLL